MFNALNTWEFNVIGNLISLVAFFQLYKFAVRDAQNDGAATILLQMIGGLSVLVFMPFFSFKLSTEWITYGMLFLATIFYALNDRLQTTARKHLAVSTFSIINQLQTAFLIIIGITIFREPLVINKLIGGLLIISGNVVMLYKKGSLKLSKHIWTAIAATLAFSIAVSIDIGISTQFNLPVYIALTLMIPALMVLLVEKISYRSIVQEWERGNQLYYLLTGFIWGLLIIFALRSYQLGEITTVVPLIALSVPLNVIFGYIFFKEKEDKLKKFIASLIVLLGMYLTIT